MGQPERLRRRKLIINKTMKTNYQLINLLFGFDPLIRLYRIRRASYLRYFSVRSKSFRSYLVNLIIIIEPIMTSNEICKFAI